MKHLKTHLEYINESYRKSDAIGYIIGKYLYHITPSENLERIKNNGFHPKDGVSVNGKVFEDRLYFATSLISAYDLSVNFSSIRDTYDYTIFKVDSSFLKEYEEDPLFPHGIYIDYPVPSEHIIDYFDADDLFDKFSEEDIEDLY